MRRTIQLFLVLVTIIATTAGIAWAVAPHTKTPKSTTSTADGSVRVLRYFISGFEGNCDGDVCGSGGPAFTFSLPPATTRYSAVLTVSFDYRTKGTGNRFALAPTLRGAKKVLVLPSIRPLAPSAASTSTTMVFRPALLTARTKYTVHLAALVPAGHTSLVALHTLVQIDAVPVRATS